MPRSTEARVKALELVRGLWMADRVHVSTSYEQMVEAFKSLAIVLDGMSPTLHGTDPEAGAEFIDDVLSASLDLWQHLSYTMAGISHYAGAAVYAARSHGDEPTAADEREYRIYDPAQ